MCGRGHDSQYRRLNTNGRTYCKRCHMLIVRALRHPEYPVKRRKFYKLNRSRAQEIRKKIGLTWSIIAGLSGISKSFMDDLLYKHHCTKEDNARLLSSTPRCTFEDLWQLTTSN